MKEEKTKKRKFLYYLVLAICVCLLTAATVLTVYFVTDNNANMLETEPPAQDVTPPDDKDPDKPTTGDAEKYLVPLAYENATVFNDIYDNTTTDRVYRHKGVDFSAAEGTKVAAMADGTIEKISMNETTGNLIIVDHGNGVKGYYKFVEPTSTLKVGAKVTKGQYFATVAAAYGSEAEDGTHLHLEMEINGKVADPSFYLDIDYGDK